jgi:xanthine/uracil permease
MHADLAYVICTVFFVDGIVTSLQLTIGDRLPLIHSAAFAYVNPTLALAAHIKATHVFGSEQERFLVRHENLMVLTCIPWHLPMQQ